MSSIRAISECVEWCYHCPIHKSGDKVDPDNYRGVSLLSYSRESVCTILNKRLTLWADENDKIVEEQSGFRAGHSTVDNMFVLYAIVQRYLLKKSGKSLHMLCRL